MRCQSRLQGALPPYQPLLAFHSASPKVIPFPWVAPEAAPPPVKAAKPRSAPPASAARSRARPKQPELDFEPLVRLPRPPEPDYRIEVRPAELSRRAGALLLDGLFLLVGFLLFLTAFHLMGGPTGLRSAGAYYGLAGLALALFYESFFCLLNCDSPGVKLARLELINFDGYAPSGWQRGLRLLIGCFSLVGLGAGWIWALFERERLTWHDIVSETCLVEADSAPLERPRPPVPRSRA